MELLETNLCAALFSRMDRGIHVEKRAYSIATDYEMQATSVQTNDHKCVGAGRLVRYNLTWARTGWN